MVWSNLIVATGHNNLAISRGVEQVARSGGRMGACGRPSAARLSAPAWR